MNTNSVLFGKIIKSLLKNTGLSIDEHSDAALFSSQNKDSSTLSYINTFFSLLADGGSSGAGAGAARDALASFLAIASDRIREELKDVDPQKLEQASAAVDEHGYTDAMYAKIWDVFSEEGSTYARTGFSKETFMTQLRKRREIQIHTTNKNAIHDPASEILFTSNALFTIPAKEDIPSLDISDDSKEKLYAVLQEPQQYWYDHPMPMGIAPESNELLYGLSGLSRALDREKEEGTVASDARITIVLSVSLTHKGLEAIMPEYIQNEIQKHTRFKNLDVFVFTEAKTAQLVQALSPVLGSSPDLIYKVFGVNGRYGRHYSFLKAIAALWSVCKDTQKRATFKIDLDQIFPQDQLIQETGKTMLQHFINPLWGAYGTDEDGKEVHMGMIAGALVNEADIKQGLFSPDVPYPKEPYVGEDVMFPRTLLMSMSTRAEMMTRYDTENSCIHRIHVTGGTNGILVSALREYQPFTPTCIGRAEDQAYLLSVYNKAEPFLRYFHASGLIMRHDKAAFASEAIQSSKVGTFAGDLLRIWLFSCYAQTLPGGIAKIKESCAPFTSSYVNKTPVRLLMSRLLFQTIDAYEKSGEEAAREYLNMAAQTLCEELSRSQDEFAQEIAQERDAWKLFYASLDVLESENNEATRQSVAHIIDSCKIQNV